MGWGLEALRPIFYRNQTHKCSLTHSQAKAVGLGLTVPSSHPSVALRSTGARVSGLLIDQTWTWGPGGERAVPFCSLVPPDEKKKAKLTASFDPAGIKIELLMEVERSGLPVSTSVWCAAGKKKTKTQRLSQGGGEDCPELNGSLLDVFIRKRISPR